MASELLDTKPDVTHPHTGIDREDRKRLANGLSGIVADTYVLMVKTHSFHWNVVGPLFISLHRLTEEQYQELFRAADELAERIRALGYPAPLSFAQMIAQSGLDECGDIPSAGRMIEELAADHERVSRRLRDTAEIAQAMRDDVTADMLTGRMAFHEKAIWMLGSLIAD